MRRFLHFSLLFGFVFSLAAPIVAQSGDDAAADFLQRGFAHPPQEALVRCYWWWLNGNTTKETITHDLEGMKSHGIAGALLVDADDSGKEGNAEVPGGPAIGSPQWMELYLHALKEAERLGIEISLNVTSRWNVGIIGGATVTPEDTLKKLTFSRHVVEGGGTRTVSLVAPHVENGFYRSIATLVYPLRHGEAAAGAKGSERAAISGLRFKAAASETGFSMQPLEKVAPAVKPVEGEQDADAADVVDVSAHVNADRVLEWNFPAGEWEVLEVGYTDTSVNLTDFRGDRRGLPLDVLSAKAFDDYWKEFVVPLLDAGKPYLGKSLKYLVTDSWETGGTNWTDGFREEFRKRRGYDPVAYLPIVSGRIVTSRATSEQFLFDLRRTVADLVAENYYDRFATLAAKYGLGTHPEAGGPHGAPFDALENFRSGTFPQTEFWAASKYHRVADTDRFFVKEAASAAHIYGKKFVAAEGETSMTMAPWSESIGQNLQPAFDQALTEGLNRLFWHEFTSSPAQYGLPGQEYFAGTHLNPNVTWWKQAPALLAAFGRAQFLMQQGKSVADVLYFYGDQVPGTVRVKSEDPPHALPGYDYDVVNEDALLHRMKFAGAELFTPEGLHYRALMLPGSQELSVAALQWLSGFVRQGGVVIAQKPLGPLGMISAQQRSEYAQTADAMWRDCGNDGAGEAHYGKGRVFCTADAKKALASLGVGADFSYRLGADAGSGEAFDYVHRTAGGAEIYFVRNTSAANVSATLSFRVKGKAPELWSADDGSRIPALVYRETQDGRTEIPLEFPASGSVFVVFERKNASHLVSLRRNGAEVFSSVVPGTGVFANANGALVAQDAGSYAGVDSKGKQIAVNVEPGSANLQFAPWTLAFPAGWGAPASVPVEKFQSWTEMSDAGIRYFSGTATYHSELKVSAEQLQQRREIWLNLGDVREIASVTVNGKPVHTLWRAPFVVRVDSYLHAGGNTVEIEVTNPWTNRLIGDQQPGATQYTHTNVRAYKKDSPLVPSGLLEPVTIQVERVEQWQR
jgi:hypothetical protein